MNKNWNSYKKTFEKNFEFLNDISDEFELEEFEENYKKVNRCAESCLYFMYIAISHTDVNGLKNIGQIGNCKVKVQKELKESAEAIGYCALAKKELENMMFKFV